MDKNFLFYIFLFFFKQIKKSNLQGKISGYLFSVLKIDFGNLINLSL